MKLIEMIQQLQTLREVAFDESEVRIVNEDGFEFEKIESIQFRQEGDDVSVLIEIGEY